MLLGRTTEEFLSMWKREAEFIMAARTKDGFPVELFKVVSERKVSIRLGVGAKRCTQTFFWDLLWTGKIYSVCV